MTRKETMNARKPRGHRMLIEVNGLTNEEAGRLYFALLAMAEASPGERGMASSNIPLPVLREIAPNDKWFAGYAPGKARRMR